MSKESESKSIEAWEKAVDGLISHLDIGYRRRKGDKLYLAQNKDVVYGAVEFRIEGTHITGPDGTKFDLAHMNYMGNEGIYKYLDRVSGQITLPNPTKEGMPN